jgi:hypothetical protein
MHARRCHKAGGFSFPVEELAAARAPKERGPGERPDNGPGFVARALLTWIADQGSGTTLIGPGKPWQSGIDESFNSKFRDECLSVEWFLSAVLMTGFSAVSVFNPTRFLLRRAI